MELLKLVCSSFSVISFPIVFWNPLVDFGTAKRLEALGTDPNDPLMHSALQQAQTMVGTSLYMSPEIFRRESFIFYLPLSLFSIVFASFVLYSLLFSSVPFHPFLHSPHADQLWSESRYLCSWCNCLWVSHTQLAIWLSWWEGWSPESPPCTWSTKTNECQSVTHVLVSRYSDAQ